MLHPRILETEEPKGCTWVMVKEGAKGQRSGIQHKTQRDRRKPSGLKNRSWPRSCSVAKLYLTLQFHGLQHTWLPCPSPSPRVCSDSCLLSQWCNRTILSSAALFSFCLRSFPASGSFSSERTLCIRWPKCWSFIFSISTSSEYSGLISSRIDWFDLVLSKGLSRVFSSTSFQRNQFFITQPSLWSNSYVHIWLLEKPWLWLYRPFVSKVMALLYNALSWFVIALTAKEYAGWNVSIKVQCRKQKPLQVFWAEKI